MMKTYTTSEAARLWNVSPRVLQKAAASGRIPAYFWAWAPQFGSRGRKVRVFYPGARNYLYKSAGRPWPAQTSTP